MARARINKAKYEPEISARFGETRKSQNLTLGEAAEKMGFKLSYVKAVEYGYISPSIDFLIKWHRVFKKTYSWILEGK